MKISVETNTMQAVHSFPLASGSFGYYAPVPLAAPEQSVNSRRSVAVADVRDVLEAAGPLTVADVAGALGTHTRDVRSVVLWMLDNGWLKLDEWERVRLWEPA